MVRSPLTAASATFALKAGEWFRRGRLLMVSPVHGDYRRYQAEIPLIVLSRFPGPALCGLIRGGVTDVDEQEPRPLRPQPVAISERSNRRRMATGGTADPARQAWRRQAHGDHAGGGERPDVHSLDRLSVARDPERPAAEKLGLRLLRSVDI